MTFEIRTSKPTSGNKFYITKSNGGYSRCITGSPTDSACDVLANCVGYACGRFNEIIGKMSYPYLNCNAEKFIERAQATYPDLEISDTPTLGGIMVWGQGSSSSSDGAGHCAVVERVDSDNQIYTSESNYGGTAFFNATRKNTNGRWGLGSSYEFLGCIVNPSIGAVTEIVDETTDEEVVEDTTVDETVVEDTTSTSDWEPAVGDIVVPIKCVDYKGTSLKQWDEKYEILQIDNRGAVLGAVRGSQRPIWAVLALDNIKLYS